ncbi:putative cytochrome p450 [Lyophyllum shimeji]|uniref:Cytochrome p450 n=1 Tax=Lyophyllum shimeji TaxID=47721 RepID=A0A9P3PC43_LYOSH|nr:putative cytochrome p450 [Lyophyllum shimeji]
MTDSFSATSTETVISPATFDKMTPVIQLGFSDILTYSLGLWLFSKVVKIWLSRWRGTRATSLRGPPSESILFGLSGVLRQSEDASLLTERWAKEYGSAFRVPTALGSSRIVLMDPKAVAHFYSKETFGYVQTPLARVFIENLFGRGVLWAEGESHRRQRKALSPAFSNAAIRRLTSVFYDSSYKMKANWDSILDSSTGDGTAIDVQKWMNHISLDSIGIAGFGHDFGTLDGKHPPVVEVFESMKPGTSTASHFVFLLGPVLPFLLRLPIGDNILWRKLHATMREIADELLERTRKEKEGLLGENGAERSVIGLLIKAENTDTQLQMTGEEVMAQNVLLLAGYETTSISLTWALIELARKPGKQQKLREELSQFSGTDPTWEQLASELPYLDSVVHEVLRLHPPVSDTSRVATEDDIIPLSTPVVTTSGEIVSTVVVKKGTIVAAPIRAINRSEAFWGPSAKEFEPERWLDDADIPAKQIQGHRHILTFSDGARICLGRNFALAEFKAALSVLIRNYTFELLDGPETKIENHRSILPRPKVAGQDGAKVPLRVRRVE